MASLAIMAGGALVNALAFSGTNFIFGQLGDHGGTEMKRHNLAVEKLSKAREEYSQERQQRLDYLNKTISQQKHAERTLGDLNAAMREYHEVTGQEPSTIARSSQIKLISTILRDSEKTQKLRSLSVE